MNEKDLVSVAIENPVNTAVNTCKIELDSIGTPNGTPEDSSLSSAELVPGTLPNGTQLSTPKTTDEPNDLIKQIIKCNKIRQQGKMPFKCARCGNEKRNIPRPILEYIKDRHCAKQTNFLYDISGMVSNVDDYVFYLLCEQCEKDAKVKLSICHYCKNRFDECCCSICTCLKSRQKKKGNLCGDCNLPKTRSKQIWDTEKELRNTLIEIRKTEKLESNIDLWIPIILSEILLRGILVSPQLEEILTYNEDAVIRLRDFARREKSDTCDSYLFLLNDDIIISEANPLELALRAPQITRLCETKLGGKYLYTQFDSIHVVLPLDEQTTEYFDVFGRDDILGETIYLNKRQYPLLAENGRYDYQNKERQGFPDELIEANLRRYKTFYARLSTLRRQQFLVILYCYQQPHS